MRCIAIALAVEECLQVSALVSAGLVVDDPFNVAFVAEQAIDDVGAYLALDSCAHSVFIPRLRMWTEKPSPAFVGHRVGQGGCDELG